LKTIGLLGLVPERRILGEASRSLLINSVLGPVRPTRLGTTLMHEHVLVDFIGAAQISRNRYNADEVFEVALPYLKRLRDCGCRSMVECTPAYIGRDPQLLARLSKASQLTLLTNTGYYGAANDKYVPSQAYRATALQLANQWIGEFRDGIEQTGIRPGIIKIGVDSGKLSVIDSKLVQAAALTHLETGLTIASHTGDGQAALEQLDLLQKAGVHPSAFIWVHAQSEPELQLHLQAARQGCWLEYDGISESSLDQHLQIVRTMASQGRLSQILLSQDAGWYHVGEPKGGDFRGFDALFVRFIPELRKAGFSDRQVHQLLTVNPRKALIPQIRRVRKIQ
jgi:predicted metal-dependent phosphotriesterase family hydrolase